MKKIIFLLLIFATFTCTNNVYAQSIYSVSGHVFNATTGEVIVGARVYTANGQNETFTNKYGYYCLLTGGVGKQVLVEYPGFKTKMSLSSNSLMDFMLFYENEGFDIDFTPMVSSADMVRHIQSQKIDIPVSGVSKLPYLLGEADAIKGLQTFPGVDFGSNGLTDLFVRGGEAGQNLMLLDGIPVYSNGHLFGFVSNFSPTMISDIQLFKGDLPAKYGGRVSSVVDVNGKEGAKQDLEGSFVFSPLTANLHLSTPIGSNGSSASLSWRRTWLDLLLKGLTQGNLDNEFKFGDLHLKSTVKINDENELKISYFHLNDLYSVDLNEFDTLGNPAINQKIALDNDNHTASLKWNSILSRQLFGSFTLGYSGFGQNNIYEELDFTVPPGGIGQVKNDVRIYAAEYQANADFEYNYSQEHSITFGLQTGVRVLNNGTVNIERFRVLSDSVSLESLGNEVFGAGSNQTALEIALYADDEYRISKDSRVRL